MPLSDFIKTDYWSIRFTVRLQ